MSSCTHNTDAPEFTPRPRITMHRFAAVLLITLAFALAFVVGISHFLKSQQEIHSTKTSILIITHQSLVWI